MLFSMPRVLRVSYYLLVTMLGLVTLDKASELDSYCVIRLHDIVMMETNFRHFSFFAVVT